ncbi:MAG: hypothetical protein ACJ70Y_01690 [Nitrososphaera sp.]
MSDSRENPTNNKPSHDTGNEEYPSVPEAAILKPEDERPLKSQLRPEENVEETEAGTDIIDNISEDMDGDGSPDWDPAVGSGA